MAIVQVLERPKTETDAPKCVVCGTPTDQECAWCYKPLHRHLGQNIHGEIIRPQCYWRHIRECDAYR